MGGEVTYRGNWPGFVARMDMDGKFVQHSYLNTNPKIYAFVANLWLT